MKKFIASGVALALLSSPALSQEAVSPISGPTSWEVCNETSFILRMAVATKDEAKESAIGWQRLRPGSCMNIDAALDKPRYVFAESSAGYQGGVREWAGRTPFCVSDENFSIMSSADCEGAGYVTRNYRAVDAAEAVTRFVEPDNFSRRAETAGIQRLLRENGYRVSRIDGVAGRRTARTLAAFVKDKKLAANLTTAQQIDALEKAALERIAGLGVKACNKSSSRVWVAVGNKVLNDWESRGWWPVEVGDCIQPVTTALIGTETHIFARQEQPNAEDGSSVPDKYLRKEGAEPSEFCMSETRFSARGRESCRENGYVTANFRPLAKDKDGVTVNFTNGNFVVQSRAGLRR